MDHKLIDDALKSLLTTKAADRTTEQVQGLAYLLREAAGVTLDMPVPVLAALPGLHEAVRLLARQFDVQSLNPVSHVTSTATLSQGFPVQLTASIYNPHGFGDATLLTGRGASPENVLQDLRNKAYDACKLVAA